MPDPVDPDDEDADPSVRPEKVEVPEVAFKPIVRFGFDKRDTREAARLPAPSPTAPDQEQEGLQRYARLFKQWASRPPQAATMRRGEGVSKKVPGGSSAALGTLRRPGLFSFSLSHSDPGEDSFDA